MIIALAGRRIDAPGEATPRFPLENRDLVRGRLETFLREVGATRLVCAAACGADLLALDAARGLGVRSLVVLPFEPERFRDLSVTNRPGDWGSAFDAVVAEAGDRGDLVVLGLPEGEGAFSVANKAILARALELSRGGPAPAAVIVWEGARRGKGDATAGFAAEARALGLEVRELLTTE